MIIARTVPELRAALATRDRDVAFANAPTTGFVPTMGALHEGHASLIRRSVAENHRTVASVFLNPTQFNNPDDLANYPVTFADDVALLERLGTDVLFAPERDAVYPDGYRYRVGETDLSADLCGATRPGHFEGVLTVVLKLLNLVKPTRAYFGEKDWQQYRLIAGMKDAFFLDAEIVPCPIVREPSGLAMSSRNRRLSAEELAVAPTLYRELTSGKSIEAIRAELEGAGFAVDYLEEREGRLFAAAFLGSVRLIDNVPR